MPRQFQTFYLSTTLKVLIFKKIMAHNWTRTTVFIELRNRLG